MASISSLRNPFSFLNFVIIELPLEMEKQQIIQILLFSSWHLISFLASLPQRVQTDIFFRVSSAFLSASVPRSFYEIIPIAIVI